MKEESRVK